MMRRSIPAFIIASMFIIGSARGNPEVQQWTGINKSMLTLIEEGYELRSVAEHPELALASHFKVYVRWYFLSKAGAMAACYEWMSFGEKLPAGPGCTILTQPQKK